MKIAIVSPYISTLADLAYYQSQQLNLAAALAGLGLEVDVITLKRSGDAPCSESPGPGVTVYRLPLLSGWMERALRQPVMKGLRGRLNKGKYDFIQSSEDFALTTLCAALYALFNGSRLVIYQGFYARSGKKVIRLLMAMYDFFAGPLLRRACAVAVCKTEEAGRYLSRKGFKGVRVIPVGVNTSVFFPEGGGDAGALELLAIGNLIARKNYPFLLDVFRRLSLMRPGARLTIIGQGPQEQWMVDYIRQHNLADKVRMIREVPNDELRRYYSRSDMFLLFSRVEIFGMVMLEAMACGCPVAATPLPGPLDVISDGVNGLIVDGNDPAGAARRISGLLDDGERLAHMRQEALRTAREGYSWPVIAGQYRDLYLSI